MENRRGIIKENVEFLILMVTLVSGFVWNQAEMKDFHGRICTLEERYMQMMERILEKK